MKIGAFKYWYSIAEAAQVAAQKIGEPITSSDIVDKIEYGELDAWFDATGRYAKRVYLASHNEPETKQHRTPGFLASGSQEIEGMMGYYRLYKGPRSGEVRFEPIDDKIAKAAWVDGTLLVDHDEESVLQIVKRKAGVSMDSRNSKDFVICYDEFPRDKIWIASDDLRGLLDDSRPPLEAVADMSATEKNAVYKLLAAMAVKNYEYKPGAKKQAKGVMSSIQDHVKSMGISLSDETIAKYLRDATSQFVKDTNPIQAMAKHLAVGK
ncbi:hypothetical protein AB1286_30015 [Trinickia sp. NRRL B-1857]|uniref:hypothetical protein n=1 Tax=Trinickia sp. NRRL B-1857 TaxID=3162879 RepID=UPI003D272F74